MLMEFLLVILFILPLFIEIVLSVWRFCYLWMPIDLLLHFEIGEFHPLMPSYITSQIQLHKVTSTDIRQLRKTSSVDTNTVNTTVASHTDDDLKYPEECSNDDDEDGSVVECCSEVDKPQLVVTVSSAHNTRMYSPVIPAIPEQQSNVQVSPPVAVPKQSTSQVPAPAVREVCPPTGKEINQPTIQEIQYPCDTRYQDGCDDSDSEDEESEEEEDRKAGVPHDNFSCDYQDLGEILILQGPLLCSSNTKIDQAGRRL